MSYVKLHAVTLAAVTAALVSVQPAEAGPPLLCFPFEIGDQASLPWGSGRGWRSTLDGYARERLIPDTLAILAPGTPVLVRMETLRRAAAYAEREPAQGRELLEALLSRGRTTQTKGAGSALARFDAGYWAETLSQARFMFPAIPATETIDGYAWMQEASASRGHDPEMEFALAMASFDGGRRGGEREAHLRWAVEGAQEGSLLARNLASHLGGRPLADLRQSHGK